MDIVRFLYVRCNYKKIDKILNINDIYNLIKSAVIFIKPVFSDHLSYVTLF